jgi:hypothetical protein
MQKRRTTADGMLGKTARRVDRKRRLVVLAMVVAVLASGIIWAAEEANNGQDSTKPLTRLDFRYQYQNLPLEDHDNAPIFTRRADKG